MVRVIKQTNYVKFYETKFPDKERIPGTNYFNEFSMGFRFKQIE